MIIIMTVIIAIGVFFFLIGGAYDAGVLFSLCAAIGIVYLIWFVKKENQKLLKKLEEIEKNLSIDKDGKEIDVADSETTSDFKEIDGTV